MTSHHPDINVLSEYASGALNPTQAIAVKTHFHFCLPCRNQVRQLEKVAAIMIEALAPQTLTQSSFEELMGTIDRDPTTAIPNHSSHYSIASNDLPSTVVSMMERKMITWRKVTQSLSAATLDTSDLGHEVSLQRIIAGSKVPEHDHRGVEMTVVLQGSFSDGNGLYQQGDFLLQEPGQIHQPVSTCNADCLCLSVQQAPVKLTGFVGRLINPFLRLQKAS